MVQFDRTQYRRRMIQSSQGRIAQVARRQHTPGQVGADARLDRGEIPEAGRLKRVLADWSPTLPGLFLYYSDRRNPHRALRAFIDCLLDRDIGRAKEQLSGAIGT
jgi:DNA-binding transcriptional LysR family regulator